MSFLYFVAAQPRHEDCFVVASSRYDARLYHEYSEVEPDDTVTAAKLCEVPESVVQIRCNSSKSGGEPFWPSPDQLKALGLVQLSTYPNQRWRFDGRIFTLGNGSLDILLSYASESSGVYIINVAGTTLCKIGFSTNVEQRFRYFTRIIPYDLALLSFFPAPDPLSLERKLHERFRDQQVRSEWFELDADDIAAAEALALPHKLKCTRP